MKFHLRWAAIALFAVTSSVSTITQAASVSGQGAWETTLQGRDLDGNLATFEAYYDTALNITWLANANAGAGSSFDDGTYVTDGAMSWINANAWAASLNFNGITGWRLPTVTDTDGPDADALGNDGCNYSYAGGTDCGYNVNTATSEMVHMFYITLGNKGYCDPATSTVSGCSVQLGWGLTNTGPFSNVQSNYEYWSATEYATAPSRAWTFDFSAGLQNQAVKTGRLYAWAVHSGDVGASTVPVPAAVWLFGSGLAGLAGFARRKKRAD